MAYESPIKKIPINIAGPTYTTRSKHVHAQTTINWYPEISRTTEGQTISLYPTPGTVKVREIGVGPHRGSIVHKEVAYFVSGDTLYSMDQFENITTIGTLNTQHKPVSMASSGTLGNQLVLVDGTDGWVYDGSTLTQISDLDFPSNPVQVAFMDSYFIVISEDSSKFYISSLNDATAWSALDFATAERDPDNIEAVVVNNREVFFVGEFTTEIWTNTGGRFPFEAYGNGLQNVGTPARHSVVASGGNVLFLMQDRSGSLRVARFDNVRYDVVSNRAIENTLQGLTKIDDAFAFIYTQSGHTFYQLTFPSENKTLVYDLTIGDPDLAWHERRTGTGAHIARTHLYYYNKHYVGSRTNSLLYRLDLDTYTDDGVAIIRERAGSRNELEQNRVAYYSLEIECETGTGPNTGQGSSPQLMLDWSDDSGYTWSNIRYLSLGGTGQYDHRILTHHLGSSRDRIFRLRVSDPLKVVLKEVYATIEVRNH